MAALILCIADLALRVLEAFRSERCVVSRNICRWGGIVIGIGLVALAAGAMGSASHGSAG